MQIVKLVAGAVRALRASVMTLGALIATASCHHVTNPPAASAALADSLGFKAERFQAVRDGLSADVAAGQIAGAHLLVGRRGKIAFSEGFGVNAPGSTVTVTDASIFRIYSMTKPIVSVVAMTLVEEGKLSLDAPVANYLPEFASASVWQGKGVAAAPAKNAMLVRHLLSHTSGLVYAFMNEESDLAAVWKDGGEERRDVSLRDYARLIAKLPLAAEPGTAWNYSSSTDILGAVVEVAGGKPLDVLVRERVTGPLGMSDTAFVQPAALKPRFVEPMRPLPGYYDDYTRTPVLLAGGEGLSSTPRDYARFVMMLAGDGVYEGRRILKQETLARMLTDETTPAIRSAGGFFPGEERGFGLGFSLALEDGVDRQGLGSFGWAGIAGTEFWVDPKNDLFMVFMVQAVEMSSEYQNKNRQWIYDALLYD